jgi:hypothetical protein
MILVERLVEHRVRVHVQAREDLGVRAGDPGRRLAQALAVRVLPDREQQLTDRGLGPGLVQPGAQASVGEGDRAGLCPAVAAGPVVDDRAQRLPPSSPAGREPDGGVSVPSPAGDRPLPGGDQGGIGWSHWLGCSH